MSFIFEIINDTSYDSLNNLINHFEISDNKNSSCYENGKSEKIEKELLNNIIQRAIDNKSRLHILYDERFNTSIPCGLIALNFEMVGEFSSLSIDYIFVSNQYRGKYYKEIDSKISFYMLSYVVQEALKAHQISPLDAIILSPINDCVKDIYLEFGFDDFNDGWLYLLMDDIKIN